MIYKVFCPSRFRVFSCAPPKSTSISANFFSTEFFIQPMSASRSLQNLIICWCGGIGRRPRLKNSCEISLFSDYIQHFRRNLFDKTRQNTKKQPQKNFFPVGDTAIDTKTFGKRFKNSQISCALHTLAGVMELADIRDLKSLGVKSVPVRARSPAPSEVPKIVAV